MKNLKIALLFLLLTSLTANEEQSLKDRNGYTYVNIASQCMTFTTSYTTKSGDLIETEARTSNPIYITGSLYRITDTLEYSTEISTTLISQRANENIKVNNQLVQKDYADMLTNNIQALGHYKLTPAHRVTFGAIYNLSSWKRYHFITPIGPESTEKVIEQRDMSLSLQAGYWYEGYHLQDSKLHLNFRSTIGLPIWSKTENTAADTTFSNRGGYGLNFQLYTGYEIYQHKEIGIMMAYSMVSKNSGKNGSAVIPKSQINNTFFGVYIAY